MKKVGKALSPKTTPEWGTTISQLILHLFLIVLTL